MLCLFTVPNARKAIRQEDYGADLDRAYEQCQGLERYAEWKRSRAEKLEITNLDAIVTRFNKEVRERHFECWRTRRLAPRIVRKYDAVAAVAQGAFDVEAKVSGHNIGDSLAGDARFRAWKYQMSSIALDLAKTRARCVKNATAIAVANAVQCAMAWEDVPSTDRVTALPLPLEQGYGFMRKDYGYVPSMTLQISELVQNDSSSDTDTDRRYRWLVRAVQGELRGGGEHERDEWRWNWERESDDTRCLVVTFF